MAKQDGEKIQIVFDDELFNDSVSDVYGNFSIDFSSPIYVPGGGYETIHRVPIACAFDSSAEYPKKNLILIFGSGTISSFRNAVGQITLNYDGAGGLYGAGGEVSPFSWNFTPADLLAKHNPMEDENVEITSIQTSGSFFRIYYSDGSLDEHVELTSVVCSGSLIHVDDL